MLLPTLAVLLAEAACRLFAVRSDSVAAPPEALAALWHAGLDGTLAAWTAQTLWAALPNAMPDILAGMRLGLTVALILSVVGEMLAGQNGLGLRILLAARAFRAPDLFAGIILLGILGLVSNAVLDLVQSRLLRWMPAQATA